MATRLKMKAKRSVKSDDKESDKSVDEYDTAILTKPLTTSINNLLKIIKLYQNTTEEIRQYLTSECDILYECRVCRSIFRSLSNFILHKRKFCQNKFSHVSNTKWFNNDDDYLDIIQKETYGTSESNKNEKDETKLQKKNLNSIIDGLTQKKEIDLEIKNLFSNEQKESQDSDVNTKCDKSLDLEHIEGSNCGVFQTLNVQDTSSSREEKMKHEIMEMHRLTEGQTAILGPDGKVINQKPVSGSKFLDSTENTNLTCPKCNITFSTRKTLLSHIKYKHESERLVYPCLECSETFATVWSVYRHLYNIHHKSLAEVRKMRSRIKAKAIKNDDSSTDKKNEQTNIDLNDQQKIDEENQAWMDNFERDNDIQMCGGCGRRFERKAALNSHSQTCQKRIIARNIINLNKQKRIAASEEKIIEKKNPSKIIRLDPEAEKTFLDKQKPNVAKKRKIGIQIRYDYSKPSDKNVPSPAAASKTVEDNDSKKKSPVVSAEKSIDLSQNSQSSDKTIIGNDRIQTNTKVYQNKSNFSLDDSDVVSIPSSNSSPNKDDQDPLYLKDLQSDSDCEIEEILGPIEHSIFGNQSSTMFNYETKDCVSDNEDENEQYKLSSINESTLKLIKLINSDIPEENLKPTLDEKMANYVNMKQLKCIPCDIKFGNISKLRHHMASHFNWNRFRCDICSFKAYDKIDVFEHIKRNHNILEFEKIEAVILQIPDWETTEFSSDVFIVKKELELIHHSKQTVIEDKKRERESSSGSTSPDNCILIESNESDEKQAKKQNQPPRPKKKIKIIKLNKNDSEHVTADTLPQDPLKDSQSDDTRSESRNSNRSTQDPALKKMVYEVIFGQDVTITNTSLTSVSSSISGEEKDSVHVVPNDVSNVISRPVRNRVKPLNKDFIYDLHDFKEHHKTVLVSNNNRKAIPLANTISESLEDLQSSKKTNKIRIKKTDKNFNKNSFGNMGNTDKNLNLQKRAIANFADNQILAGDEGFPQSIITVVDPKVILNANNSTQSDGEDDDIYIVENEELVAVK